MSAEFDQILEAMNSNIEKLEHASNIAAHINRREKFCRENHILWKLSSVGESGNCLSCGRTLEGRAYHFHYGKLVDSSRMEVFIPGLVWGSAEEEVYDAGSMKIKSGHICFVCYPGSGEEEGSRMVLEASQPDLERLGYAGFFTPGEYQQLRRREV